ncbi:ComEC/Rec2 family competence protein [Verrucomicrobia bacterium]|nr:ComEC/Rec2 family competence protein [Verrucomicrobiota bacterium]
MRAPIYYALTPFLLGITANSIIDSGYGSLLIGICGIMISIIRGWINKRPSFDRINILALGFGAVLNVWLYIGVVTEEKEVIESIHRTLPPREVVCSIKLIHVNNQFGRYGKYDYFKGIITRVPETRKDLVNKTVEGMFPIKKDSLIIESGDVIKVKGIIKYNDLKINYRIYYMNQFIVERKNVLSRIKTYILNNIKNDEHTTKEYQGFICAFLFGEKEFMTERQDSLFRNIGTMHIFAVSGLHIGIAFLILYQCLKATLRQKQLYLPITLIILFCYVSLIGFPPSACRAYLMVFFWQISILLCRKRNSFSILGWTALLLLLIDHSLLFSTGFQLSFTVVMAILWVLPKQGNKKSFVNLFKISFIVSYTSFCSSIIIIIDRFNYINPLSIIVNGLLMPFIFIVFIACIFYLITLLLYPMEYISNLTELTYAVIEYYSQFFNSIKYTHFYFPVDYYTHDSFHLIIPLMLVLTRDFFTTLWQKLAFLTFLPASILIVNSTFN